MPWPIDRSLPVLSVHSIVRRRKGPRSRDEVRAERQKLHDDTALEIDALIQEYHALLPRDQATAIGAIYARYSTRFQHSIVDQVRGLLQDAVQKAIFIPREYVFFDLAIRGAKQRRPGLVRLKELLARKSVQALLVFTTNRLARKTYKALQFVEEEVVGRGIRCLFVKSGVDSADTRQWRMLLNLHASIDEHITSMYAENIRVAQEGLFRSKLVFGTITFGYRGKEVAGPPTRQKRPRREYEIDPETAEWVRKVFTWYVRDGLAIAEIIRRLNEDGNAPLGPKATSGRWTRMAVHLLLANSRYRGYWAYGTMQGVWQVKQDYTRQVEREQPLAQEQFEELRIIDDEMWYAASRRLATEKARDAGRKPKDGDRKSRPRLLNGLFNCPDHGQCLYVGGPHGKNLICPACQDLPAEQRPLFSYLNRVLALRLTCAKLSELVRADDGLVRDVIAAFRREAEKAQDPDPAGLMAVVARVTKLRERIAFVMANPGDTELDRDESSVLLRRLRADRAEAEMEKAALEAARDRPNVVPTEQEVIEALNGMKDALLGATLDEAGPNGAVREIIELLTNGRIELEQQGERKAQRGWLRGRFRSRLLDAVVSKIPGVRPLGNGPELEVTIDYRKPNRWEKVADEAKRLYDQGLMNRQIAAALGCGENTVTKLLKQWFRARGKSKPDGRARRSSLPRKQLRTPLYVELAAQAKTLWDQGMADLQIAARLGCSPPTAVAAIEHWHSSRGLQAPSHAERREELVKRMKNLYDRGLLLREIARDVGMCTSIVRAHLRKHFADLGLKMPDGRSRRHKLVPKPKEEDGH